MGATEDSRLNAGAKPRQEYARDRLCRAGTNSGSGDRHRCVKSAGKNRRGLFSLEN